MPYVSRSRIIFPSANEGKLFASQTNMPFVSLAEWSDTMTTIRRSPKLIMAYTSKIFKHSLFFLITKVFQITPAPWNNPCSPSNKNPLTKYIGTWSISDFTFIVQVVCDKLTISRLTEKACFLDVLNRAGRYEEQFQDTRFVPSWFATTLLPNVQEESSLIWSTERTTTQRCSGRDESHPRRTLNHQQGFLR